MIFSSFDYGICNASYIIRFDQFEENCQVL